MSEKRARILIVDDSAMVRALHAYILQAASFDTMEAESGFMAIEVLQRCPCDLAVVDLNMPHMDGLTLIRHLRAESTTRDMPIIIVTTEEEEEDRRQGFDAGANVYVVKPTDPAQLVTHALLLLGAAGLS
jgi:two-component system chemotaxis response regulator CheY